MCRREGLSEEATSQKLGFGSVEAMHRQLTQWGAPTWMVGGGAQEQKPKRKARRSGGEKKELSSAGTAGELFRGALKRLEHDVAELSRRVEYLKDGRFVVELQYSGDAGESYRTYHRSGEPENVWREFCERHGADPGLDSLTVWEDRIVSGGVSWAPPEPLTRLIAFYILSGEPLELLLKALHDDPEAVNKEQLDRHIYDKQVGLTSAAERVARIVRGSDVPPGPRTPGLSRREEEAAAYIGFQRSCGVSDEKILQELRDGFGFSKPVGMFADPEECTWPDMKMDDLKRLGEFRLPSIFSGG